MVNIIIVLLYLLSFLLIWQFVGYPSLMAVVALRAKPKNKDYSFQPFVSVIVPTYNEEKVIEKRIENLLDLDYSKDKYEIIVVDSGSTDKTADIIEAAIKKHEKNKPVLRFLKENERKGKASAINFGKKHAKGEIVLITDANSIFDKNVLKEMMPHFKNPKVGAVGGRYCVANPENPLASSESFYWDLEYLMRRGESTLDSACLFHGEINAWRKYLIDADTQMLSEDLDMCIRIRKKGYKIEYEPNAIVYEPSAITREDQVKQRKRTSVGTIQNMFKHWKYFLPPRDWYSLLIFPSHKGLAMFSPFFSFGNSYFIYHCTGCCNRDYTVCFDFANLCSNICSIDIFKIKIDQRRKDKIDNLSILDSKNYVLYLAKRISDLACMEGFYTQEVFCVMGESRVGKDVLKLKIYVDYPPFVLNEQDIPKILKMYMMSRGDELTGI